MPSLVFLRVIFIKIIFLGTQATPSHSRLVETKLLLRTTVWERQFVGLQTGPCTQRARRDWRKKRPTPDRQVTVLISRETCIGGLPQDKKIPAPAHQTLRGLYVGLGWVQSCILSRQSQQPLTLSRLCPWNSSYCGNSGQNIHFKDRGGEEEPLTAQVQLMGQPVVTSSQWPPPTKLNT